MPRRITALSNSHIEWRAADYANLIAGRRIRLNHCAGLDAWVPAVRETHAGLVR